MAWRVGVVGATGAVGQTLLAVLAERRFPVAELRLLATQRSAGTEVVWGGERLRVQPTGPDAFGGLEICFLAVPGSRVSRELAPLAVQAGAVVIDKGSAFRLDPGVPLVVPEVNAGVLRSGPGIIASPNCTTIPLVLCLDPLRRLAGLRRVIVSTYQSASGAGHGGMEELAAGVEAVAAGRAVPQRVFPRPLAHNVVPQCDAFGESGYTAEEWKLVHETRKILAMPELRLTATAVRVPVPVGHGESVAVETDRPCTPAEARGVLAAAGVRVHDLEDPTGYPTPADVAGSDLAHVGRVRQDLGDPNGLHFWVVGDNLRKGAATNAVQIAEALIRL